MPRNQTVPGSVRIRTGEGNEWRFDAIQQAANYYDCNRSDAVAHACEDVRQLVKAGQKVLERDDLTQQQRKEIAETLSTRAVNSEINLEITVIEKP